MMVNFEKKGVKNLFFEKSVFGIENNIQNVSQNPESNGVS